LLKNLFHKGVIFESPKKGRGKKEGKEREGAREGSPPIHIPGYATA